MNFDVGHTIAVIDLDAATTLTTGKNIYMGDCKGVTFIVSKGKGTTDDFALDLQEVDTIAGTPRDLDIITEFYAKIPTSTDLLGSETWTKCTQTAASEIAASQTNMVGTCTKSILVALTVFSDQLSDGYNYLAVNVPDLGSGGAQWGTIIAIKFGLLTQRAPANLPAFLR